MPAIPQTSPSQAASAPAPIKEQKKGRPVAVTVIAAVVALGLSGAALYAFSHSEKPASNKTANSSASPQPIPLTEEDLKDFSTNMETSMGALNDSKDFNQTDLSDSGLGL
jgi:flagellar basal body-associated protein FliL